MRTTNSASQLCTMHEQSRASAKLQRTLRQSAPIREIYLPRGACGRYNASVWIQATQLWPQGGRARATVHAAPVRMDKGTRWEPGV